MGEEENQMAVQMMCPSLRCRRLLQVSEDARGKLVQCQHCQTKFRVPGIAVPASGTTPTPRKGTKAA
jgi:hypothetical protein